MGRRGGPSAAGEPVEVTLIGADPATPSIADSKRRGSAEGAAPRRHGGPGLELARPFLEAQAAAFAGAPHRIQVDCDPGLQLPAAELAAIGTIVGEAVANALKHAFPPGRDGRIWIRLAMEGDRVKLTIRDDGIGMTDLPISGQGSIDTLAVQLGGYARLGSAPFGGALVTVVYPRGV